jgi:hypothetical protein
MPAITPDRRLASLTEAANPLAWVACIDFEAVCIPVIVLGNNGSLGDLSLLFFIGPQPDPVFDPFGHSQYMPWMYAAHFP